VVLLPVFQSVGNSSSIARSTNSSFGLGSCTLKLVDNSTLDLC